MKQRILVDEDMSDLVAGFFRDESVGAEVVTEGECAVRVVRSEGRPESSLTVLQSGGWIKCEVARTIAENLGLTTRSMGRLLELLNIKIRECGLGCF